MVERPPLRNRLLFFCVRAVASYSFILFLLSIADIAFLNDKISPDFIVVSEAEQIRLRCTYCAISPNATSLSWYKEGVLIANSSRYVLRNAELDIPVAEHSKDEGLYECIVKSKNQNISRFITLIVQKGKINL